MNDINTLGEVISTDVLVIGGGISGLQAGIKASLKGASTLIVDKCGIGWAGAVPLTAGICMAVPPERFSEWFDWAVRYNGEFLNNQDWTEMVGNEIYKTVLNEIEQYSLPFLLQDGKMVLSNRQKYYPTARYNPVKVLIRLKKVATKYGVRMMDKIFIVDLLQRNGRIIGAVGFGLIDGKTYILEVKATIIANGSLMSGGNKFFTVNTGSGIAMAYRAGAEMMNAEFGPGFGYGFKDGELYKRTNLFLYYENALGERFMGNYCPEFALALQGKTESITEDFSVAVDAMVREVMAGRGPIYLDFRKIPPEKKKELSGAVPFQELEGTRRGSDFLGFFKEKTGIDPFNEKVEVVVQNTCVGVGPIRVGLGCETSLEGLYAVGDACQNGSGWIGARGSGTNSGWCIPFAIVSGNKGGETAAAYAQAKDRASPEQSSVRKTMNRMLAPLGRKGTAAYDEVLYQIQEAIIPVKYSMNREAGRLKEALNKIEAAREHLPYVGANDHHELAYYFQAEAWPLWPC